MSIRKIKKKETSLLEKLVTIKENLKRKFAIFAKQNLEKSYVLMENSEFMKPMILKIMWIEN